MSEELNQPENNPAQATVAPVSVSTPAVKRGRGRPPGSKNKPKPEGYIAPTRKKKATAETPVAPAKQVVTHTTKTAAFVVPSEDTDNVVESPVETADISE